MRQWWSWLYGWWLYWGKTDISSITGEFTGQKMKFSIKDFFSEFDQISRLMKKSVMENFIFCVATEGSWVSFLENIRVWICVFEWKYATTNSIKNFHRNVILRSCKNTFFSVRYSISTFINFLTNAPCAQSVPILHY